MQPTARDRDLTYAMEAPAFSYTSPMSTKVNPSPSLPLPYRTTVYSTAQNSSDSFSEARITPERLPTLQIDQIPMNALSISFPSTPDNVVYGGALSPGEPLWLGLNVDMAGSADGYRSYLSHVPPADIKCPPSSPGDDLLSPFSGESSGSPGSASDYMSSPACESPSSPSPIRGRGVSRSAPASRRSSPYSFSHVTRHHRHRSADESIDDMRLEDIARPVVGSSNMMRANHSKRRSEATWECPLCDGTFTRRGSLKSAHLALASDKMYSWMRPRVLGHMNSHSGRRDFHCSHCNSTFLNRPDMTRHQKNLHGQEGATEQTPG
ncbi:hypothetical protein PLICRDRAFT_563132 [Plicaturopsis crispa FD-325 SS-3]|nr:hypothetical protein PLICRDRAFT_563132 [Plicaturopsis crispa FD-325 SS-3]